jgi:hypothetical protein
MPHSFVPMTRAGETPTSPPVFNVLNPPEETMTIKRLPLFVASLCAAVSLSALIAAPRAQEKFETPKGKTPFAGIAVTHPIDGQCPRAGSDDSKPEHQAQNAAKNDFTATGSKPVAINFNDFTRLQRSSDSAIAGGEIELKGKYPVNRDQRKGRIKVQGKSVGEGSLVTLEAYVYGAHYSNTKLNHYGGGDVGSGEANNCNNTELDWNDIHVALIGSPTTGLDECNTVTAELSPHYRPESWDRFHDGLIEKIESAVPGLLRHKVVMEAKAGDVPLHVRVTGTLFYDASHGPVRAGQRQIQAQLSSTPLDLGDSPGV